MTNAELDLSLAPADIAPKRQTYPRYREVTSALIALTKPRIIELLLVTTLPAMVLAQRGVPPVYLLVVTVAGGAMAAGGANALNMVLERDIDAKMARTKNRPLVTGTIPVQLAAAFAVILEVAAFVLLASEANVLAACLAVGAAAFYVLLYTALLKRRTPQNIVIGGAAGAAPVLVGWAAVTGGLSPLAWGLFGLIFLWTPPHFWALAVRYRGDYAGARVPMLPSVMDVGRVANRVLGYALGLFVLSVGLGPAADLGALYTLGAVVLGAIFVGQAIALKMSPGPERAMALFRGSITYLSLLFVLIGVVGLLQR